MAVELQRGPEVGIEARRIVSAFADRLGPARTEDARLLVTELAANAFRHGAGTITLRVDVFDDLARFAVSDGGEGRPEVRAARGPDGGWGLRIVDRVADRWGVEQGNRSTNVWFELRS